MAMTALRQIFLAGIREAYTDSGNPIWEKISNGALLWRAEFHLGQPSWVYNFFVGT
jgi:hypothetical protein